MNWMIHNEDSTVQLDIWEQLLNLTGWNWQTLSTAFRESETFYAPPANMSAVETYDLANHGSTGPICSTLQRSVLSLLSDYVTPNLKAAVYAVLEDRNGGKVTGAGFLPLAICPNNYTRSYSGSAYTAVQTRSNLHVHTNTQVTGINWQSSAMSAVGITATGSKYVNKTSGSNASLSISGREIVLSAGTIQFPQSLGLSGVGNSTILQSAGVQSVIDLPSVGTDLRDPLIRCPIHYTMRRPKTTRPQSTSAWELHSTLRWLPRVGERCWRMCEQPNARLRYIQRSCRPRLGLSASAVGSPCELDLCSCCSRSAYSPGIARRWWTDFYRGASCEQFQCEGHG